MDSVKLVSELMDTIWIVLNFFSSELMINRVGCFVKNQGLRSNTEDLCKFVHLFVRDDRRKP